MQVYEVSLRRGAAKYITGVPQSLFLNELKHCPDNLVAAEKQFHQHWLQAAEYIPGSCCSKLKPKVDCNYSLVWMHECMRVIPPCSFGGS